MTTRRKDGRPCPCCRERDFDFLFRQKFAPIVGVSIVDGYDVIVCDACGMLFADRIPDQATFDAYYAAASKYEYPQRAGEESPWDWKRFENVAKSIANLIPDRGARILDVGAATGGLVSALVHQGYARVTGLEPSPICVAAAKAKGRDVRQGNVTTLLADDPERWDAMLLVGVLEHIHDVRATLAVLRDRLTPDGVLYIEVPDARRFDLYPDAPFQAFSTEHINFFTKRSLHGTLARAGFDVVDEEENAREQSATVTMSNVSTLARRTERPIRPERDHGGQHALVRYIEKSSVEEQAVRTAIDMLVRSQEPVILWGAGTFTRRLFATTPLAQAKICGVIDANEHLLSASIAGFLISHPVELSPPRPMFSDVPIIIASVPFAEEILAMIAKMGLPNPVRVLHEGPP